MTLTQAQVNQLDLFPIYHLPTQLFEIMGAGKLQSSTAIPEFLPYTKKIDFLNIITAQATMKAFMNPLQALMDLSKKMSAKNEKNVQETEEDKRKNQERKEIFAFIQLYLEYCQQELTQNKQL